MLFNLRTEPWRAALLDAADEIERHGHCKNELEDKRGRLCLIAAVHKAMGRPSLDRLVFHDALDRIRVYLGGCPAAFNNAPERTAADVVAALRGCAAS